MDRNRHDRNQVEDRADHPHQRACCCLIAQRGYAEDPWPVGIAGIDHSAGKAQRRGQRCIHQVRADEIRQYGPSRTAGHAGPWLDHRKPEEQRGAEEAGVFHFMPAGRTQCQLIRRRHVPAEVGDIHGQPCEHGMGQQMRHPVQGGRPQEGAQSIAQHRAWQRSQQWEPRVRLRAVVEAPPTSVSGAVSYGRSAAGRPVCRGGRRSQSIGRAGRRGSTMPARQEKSAAGCGEFCASPGGKAMRSQSNPPWPKRERPTSPTRLVIPLPTFSPSHSAAAQQAETAGPSGSARDDKVLGQDFLANCRLLNECCTSRPASAMEACVPLCHPDKEASAQWRVSAVQSPSIAPVAEGSALQC